MVAKIIAAFMAWLGPVIAIFFSRWKLVAFTLVSFILGVVVYNELAKALNEILQFALSKTSALSAPEGTGGVKQFSGFVGCMMAYLKIPECVSFIVWCVSFKFLARKIPFLNW